VVCQAMKSHDLQSGMEVGLQTASDPGATAPGVATTKICDPKTPRLTDDHFVTSRKSQVERPGYSPPSVVSQAMISHDACSRSVQVRKSPGCSPLSVVGQAMTSHEKLCKSPGCSPLSVVSQAMKSCDQQSGMEVGLQTASDPGATAPGVATTKRCDPKANRQSYTFSC
jgi:hypothetical protein